MALDLPEKDRSGNSVKPLEWTAILTIISILAFSSSVCEVLALGLSLRTQLTSYFSPIDYVKITPAWAGLYFALTGLVIASVFAYAALPRVTRGSSVDFKLGELLLGDFWLKIPRKRRAYVIFGFGALGFLGLRYLSSFGPPFSKHIWVFTALSALVVLQTYFFCTVLAAFSKVLNTITRKALMFIFFMAIVFAFCHGLILEPLFLFYAPVSRITFEIDKDRSVSLEGKIIYDLDRYLLLVIGDNKSIIAIPHEKIKSIETPPLEKSDLEEIRSRKPLED
jgi:hypothetical protein